MTTDNLITSNTAEHHFTAMTKAVKILSESAPRSNSLPPARTMGTGKVVIMCGAMVNNISVPYDLQKEVERQRNLAANRGTASGVSTSQHGDEG